MISIQLLTKFPMIGLFDYNAKTDFLEMTSSAFACADHTIRIPYFYETLNEQDWLSPETRSIFSRLIPELINHPEYGVLEHRADYDGSGMRWHRIQYAGIKDENGKLEHVIGLSTDIEEEHKRINSWKKKASQDIMTGLLNHSAVSEQIAQAICDHDGGTLMLMDIDNFKQINDTAGHMQGDLFLKKAAENLRSMFRNSDIVGRYGGDEFVAFLPGIKDADTARHKAELIIKKISGIPVPVLEQTGCSVGISIAENAGVPLTALFKQVDFALYEAKAYGKGHYVIIENGQAVHQKVHSTSEDPYSTQADQISGALFDILHHAPDRDAGVNDALAYVGRLLDISRVYIMETIGDGPLVRNTYEWCNKGITPEIDNLQCIDTSAPGMNFYENYGKDDMWFCPDVELLPPRQRDFLKQQNIRSMIHWVFRKEGRIMGLIGFDECQDNRVWGTRHAQLLRRAGEVISEYLLYHEKR